MPSQKESGRKKKIKISIPLEQPLSLGPCPTVCTFVPKIMSVRRRGLVTRARVNTLARDNQNLNEVPFG